MLPLTFSDPADYDKVQPFDKVSLLGLADLAPGKVSYVVVVVVAAAAAAVVVMCGSVSVNVPPSPTLQPVKCVLRHEDGSSDELMLQHTMNEAQIGWFKAGSALNKMAEMFK